MSQQYAHQRLHTAALALAKQPRLSKAVDQLLAASLDAIGPDKHGDWDSWMRAIGGLAPATDVLGANQFRDAVHIPSKLSDCALTEHLKALHPWRKGPISVGNVCIDTEWRSDWKWDRIAPHIDVQDHSVLDIGCGNGYFGWRMLGAGAHSVLGLDPTRVFFAQYLALEKLIGNSANHVFPVGIEALLPKLEAFDTVFSMGVLYHRKDPIGHLKALKLARKKTGQVVLETLVVEGDSTTVLVPRGRYARMRNVWFIPSVKALELWLKKVGFRDVQCLDVTATSTEEQRSTDWMRFESLPQCLDPADNTRTLEGYPAPLRAVFVAR